MVKIANTSGKVHSSVNLHVNSISRPMSYSHDICKATSKTTTFIKRTEKALHSVAFGQLCEQEITFKEKDSNQVSVLRRRWCGYSVKNEGDELSPVLLKYDELTYPVTSASLHSAKSLCSCGSNNQQSSEVKGKWWKSWLLTLVCLALCIFLLGRNLNFQNTCNEIFDTQTFSDILNENVFGQDEAKEQLITALNTLNPSTNSNLKFIIFSGGSGVGKTYIASLLSQFFPWPDNIYKFMAPVHFDVTTNIIEKHLSSCGYNLVIIDDLKESYVSLALELKRYYKLLYKDYNLKIILIMIFSTGKNLSIDNMVSDFNKAMNLGELIESEDNAHHLKFNVLKESDVLKCVEKSLYLRGVSEPLTLINKFSDNFMSTFLLQDGCKRVSSKVSVLLEMHEQKKAVGGHF